jgi:hypothetical protein
MLSLDTLHAALDDAGVVDATSSAAPATAETKA